MAATQFTIQASQYYLNSTSKNLFPTNIELNEGDLLKINSQGISPISSGSYKYDKNTNNLDFEFPVGSLVGTLDNGNSFFPVAQHLELMFLDNSKGKLSLVFWGVDATTNISSVAVTIEVQQNKAFSDLQATDAIDSALLKDRFSFAVHAYANSMARRTSPGYGGDYQGPEPFLDTGIQLQPGDLLKIDASPKDLWSPDGGFFTNANAIAVAGNRGYDRVTSKGQYYRISSLIGTLDEGKTFFPVGTHLEMTVLKAGSLSLLYWDVDWGNNYGFIKAFVQIIRNGKILTSLDIKTVTSIVNGSSSGTANDYSNLDCSTNLPKLNANLKSALISSK
ncbi:hypothetical protein G7B40_035875 [Aetokthonos hydrillicola Thurmond2011]|jgi:hypothetical protein|uniref:Uncharacterized protein n=1 Tax=Aetokthonos hydrillicola Thurmond2011 TaxID=2712845 RepID=A0AAP5MD18_9CYAN|nr:hypothetical protein [Aetokthonos hydrillicola]MBO3460744.1 hypothetical protein [Aetokthonos hydrillicola CCALA 1050]MBW4586397.1 hypothetical protein [Aetokthonos hydrillicola CCALA 1050]MDR9899897.1 hypothetical protein [Aetokthonos hydrillicola Thurmond2011]